ncbi:YihY/virulence factor BrkB family protein [Telmatobacter sp. DSM 110680]|uniref:YihY/virulence factor BrkB family protein n=1 Tax=Telmatobacter sp. DSM 110680 TaxID=3036704 RepID=A0AAU7DPK7_9BACT
MESLTSTEVRGAEALPKGGGFETKQPVTVSKWYRWRRSGVALADYLLDAEVHTYAFSVAANAIISFIPLIVLLYTIALSVFHSQEMVNVVNKIVEQFLPSTAIQATSRGNEDFLAFWLRTVAVTSSRHNLQALSLLMILVSCTGIFLPLEVALNQAWGVAKSRNYLLNQVVAFGLAILMLFLAVGSVFLSTWQRQLLGFVFFHHTDNFVFEGISYLWLSATTGLASILFFFSIYWLLPNRKIRARQVAHTAIITGIVWLIAKEAFAAVLPHLDLKALYGPFYVSVGLLFWAYISGLILFAGAQFSAVQPLEKTAGE